MSHPESQQIPAEALEALVELRSAYPQVRGAGARYAIGIKQTSGTFTPQIALIVYVDKKKPPSELSPQEIIPAQFLGFATDVVEDRGTLIADHTLHNPLIGGIEISVQGDGVVDPGSGTLGAIVRDRIGGFPRLLTCGHVVSAIGQPMYQPTHGREGSAIIGMVLQSVFAPNTPPDRDWALIEPTGTRELEFAVKEVGALARSRAGSTLGSDQKTWADDRSHDGRCSSGHSRVSRSCNSADRVCDFSFRSGFRRARRFGFGCIEWKRRSRRIIV